MTSILHDDHSVIDAVCSSESIREALDKLGLRAAGGNYDALKKACDRLNLSYPSGYKAKGRTTIIPLNEILVENSNYSNRKNIKKRLFANGMLENKCYKCGLPPEWNGQSLSLHLEHKNGIHNDNRIENLEILCPNCHSQTDTYAGKRFKTKSLCPNCHSPKSKGSNLCNTCAKLTPRKKKIEWPSIPELRTLVESIGYVQAGKQLGVSDNAIRKHLRTE